MACNIKRDPLTTLLEPIHQHDDGSWWWYDETWVEEHGPYSTIEEANLAITKYCREELGYELPRSSYSLPCDHPHIATVFLAVLVVLAILLGCLARC